jgi:O-antigen/teichoic acid export membrane protein
MSAGPPAASLGSPPPGDDHFAESASGLSAVHARIAQLRTSKFVRDSLLLLILALLSRGVALFGSAWAARTLGPSNLGVSALVQATAQQAGLASHGGFDTVAVRKIAGDSDTAESVAAAVLTFRMAVAGAVSVIWIGFVLLLPDLEHRFAWLFGVPLVLLAASNIRFLFAGLEKLPVQNAISTGGTLLGALLYFAFFRPGMSAGADLVVISATALAVTVFSWAAYVRLFKRWPTSIAGFHQIRTLLRESWQYWLMAVVIYLYSSFQIPLVAYILGSYQAGLYRSAFMMAAAVELLFGTINSLLLPRLVAWRKLGADVLWRRQNGLLVLFCGIGLPPVVLLMAASPLIFDLFLGPEFANALSVFRILLVGRLVVFWGQIYAFGLAAVGEDTAFLLASTLGAVAGVTLSTLGALHFGITAVAVSSVVAELLVVSTCFFSMRASIMREMRGSGR